MNIIHWLPGAYGQHVGVSRLPAPLLAADKFAGCLSTLHDIRQQAEQQAHNQSSLAGRVTVIEEWLMSLDRRVAGMQGSAESAPEPGLSAAHLVDMRTLFRLLEQTTGSAQAHLTQELIETVRVSAIDAIPDRLWSDVLTWCWWQAQQPA